MIYVLDADLAGTDSIADILKSKPKEITHIPLNTYEDFDNFASKYAGKLTPNDLVVLDTLNMLANTTRGDMALGTDTTQNLWGLRNNIIGNKNHGASYEATGQLIIRRLKNLGKGGQGARIIVTCHEAEKVDDTTSPPSKKRGPDVNPALLGALIGSASDVFRLRSLEYAVTNDKGEVVLPADTRILELRRTEEIMAKVHVPPEIGAKLPKAISNPTLPMLYEKLGKKPSWLVIYGPPGVGKTSFAISELR